MRKLMGLLLVLGCLLTGCADPGEPGDAGPTTPAVASTPRAETGVPAGGTAGAVTVPNGETIVLSTSVLGGDVDRVELTVAVAIPTETLPGWYSITVYLGIVVRSGVYLMGPNNVVLVGGDGTVIKPDANTFGEHSVGIAAGSSSAGILIFEVHDESILDDATVAVYGIAEDAAALVAYWDL